MIGKFLLLLTAVGMSAMARGGGNRGGNDKRGKGRRPGGGQNFGMSADRVDELLGKARTKAPPPLPSRKTDGKNGWDDRQTNEPDPRDKMPNLGNIDQRRKHILDGDSDDPNGGGHRYGTGRPGKTEFPKHWQPDKVITDAITDVAKNPDSPPLPRKDGGYEVTGHRGGVKIKVVLNADGTVWTAHPVDGIGVRKNPR